MLGARRRSNTVLWLQEQRISCRWVELGLTQEQVSRDDRKEDS
jgi:hypothetical protein